jgi:hypothetical protein
MKFMIRAVYHLLPTPSNLATWKLTDDPSCYMCGERGSLRHILSGCHISLTQGRYRWWHDKVLREIADIIELERKKKNTKKQGQPS